jgi:hypothetical protein
VGLVAPHEAWDYEGDWGGNLGTPIAPHFFLSAAHIGQAVATTFILQDVNYTVVRGFYDPLRLGAARIAEPIISRITHSSAGCGAEAEQNVGART